MKLLLIQATLLFQQADLFIQFHMVLHFRLASMGVQWCAIENHQDPIYVVK